MQIKTITNPRLQNYLFLCVKNRFFLAGLDQYDQRFYELNVLQKTAELSPKRAARQGNILIEMIELRLGEDLRARFVGIEKPRISERLFLGILVL